MKKSLTNSQNPEVSIVIASYNTREVTLKCLRAIASDASLPVTEIIVIDNASKDGPAEAIKNEFPKVIFIQNTTNRGLAAADNQGLEKAKGKYLVLLNSDAFVQMGSIRKLANFLTENKDTGVVVPRLLNQDGSVQPSCFPEIGVISTFKAYWLGQRNLVEKYYPRSNSPSAIKAAVSATMMIRRNLIIELGGMDEQFFLYFDDLDLCRRVRQKGKKIFYLPSASVTHLHGTSGKSNPDFGYLRETILYPLKKLLSLWHPTISQEYFFEGSIRYFGWWRHLIITLIIKYPAKL
jgi:hypothetical protein